MKPKNIIWPIVLCLLLLSAGPILTASPANEEGTVSPKKRGAAPSLPGSINQICYYTNFFYNDSPEDFFHHLNDYLLFSERPDGEISDRLTRFRLLTVIRWRKLLMRSLARAQRNKKGMITLNVSDDAGYKKAVVILRLLGLKMTKDGGGAFRVTPNPTDGLTRYYLFAGINPGVLERQLNKTRRFHLKLTEGRAPLPWDLAYLRDITGLEMNAENFFETMLKNERFSLLLGVLYRLSHREIRAIDQLFPSTPLGAWKKIYTDKKLLMGMFFLSHALRVDERGRWTLPGGPAAAPFWAELTGKDPVKSPFGFLKQVAVRDDGKLNYLFLFGRFLPETSQKLLFTGAYAEKMREIYHRLTLKGGEKLKEIQFPGLENGTFFSLLYALRTRDGDFYFPMGADTWKQMVSHYSMGSFLKTLSVTGGAGDTAPAAVDEAVVLLPGGERLKGAVQSRSGNQLVVVAAMEPTPAKETEPEAAEPGKTGEADEETADEKIEAPIEEEFDINLPGRRSFFSQVLGRFKMKRRFFFRVNYNSLNPASTVYRDLYGDWFFSPEFKVGGHITRRLSLWFRRGAISGKTVIPVLDQEATSKQVFKAYGIGYHLDLSKSVACNVDLGLVRVTFNEKSRRKEVNSTASGFRLDGDFTYTFGKHIFTGVSAGYVFASSELTDRSVKLGGLTGGIGIGFRF